MNSPITLGDRREQDSVDETAVFCPKFDANGLLAAIAIDAETR